MSYGAQFPKWDYKIEGCKELKTDGVSVRAVCDTEYEGQFNQKEEVKAYTPVTAKILGPPPPAVLPNPYDTKKFEDRNLMYANMCADMYHADGKIICIPLGSYLQVCNDVKVNSADLMLTATCYDGTKDPLNASYNLNNWKGEHLTFYNNRLAPDPKAISHLAPGARFYTSEELAPITTFKLNMGAVGGSTTQPTITKLFWIPNQINGDALSQFKVGRYFRFLDWDFSTGKGTKPSPFVKVTRIINPRAGNKYESQIDISDHLKLVPNTSYFIDFSFIFKCHVSTINRRTGMNTIANSFTFITSANIDAVEQFSVGRRFRLLNWDPEKAVGEQISSYTTITRIEPFTNDQNQTHVFISPPLMMKADHLTMVQIID